MTANEALEFVKSLKSLDEYDAATKVIQLYAEAEEKGVERLANSLTKEATDHE